MWFLRKYSFSKTAIIIYYCISSQVLVTRICHLNDLYIFLIFIFVFLSLKSHFHSRNNCNTILLEFRVRLVINNKGVLRIWLSSLDFEHTWWRLFQKHVVWTKLDIFFLWFVYLWLFWCNQNVIIKKEDFMFVLRYRDHEVSKTNTTVYLVCACISLSIFY